MVVEERVKGIVSKEGNARGEFVLDRRGSFFELFDE